MFMNHRLFNMNQTLPFGFSSSVKSEYVNYSRHIEDEKSAKWKKNIESMKCLLEPKPK